MQVNCLYLFLIERALIAHKKIGTCSFATKQNTRKQFIFFYELFLLSCKAEMGPFLERSTPHIYISICYPKPKSLFIRLAGIKLVPTVCQVLFKHYKHSVGQSETPVLLGTFYYSLLFIPGDESLSPSEDIRRQTLSLCCYFVCINC